jgi:hypothetical protein
MTLANVEAERNTKSAVVYLKPESSNDNGLTHTFSPQAAALWKKLPDIEKQIILNNVYCGQCHIGVTMINVSGFTERSSLVLQGSCGVCGGNVARVIEELD